MHTLSALLVVTAAACAIARPPTPGPGNQVINAAEEALLRRYAMPLSSPNLPFSLGPFYPYDLAYPAYPAHDDYSRRNWIIKEIERINRLSYKTEDDSYPEWARPGVLQEIENPQLRVKMEHPQSRMEMGHPQPRMEMGHPQPGMEMENPQFQIEMEHPQPRMGSPILMPPTNTKRQEMNPRPQRIFNPYPRESYWPSNKDYEPPWEKLNRLETTPTASEKNINKKFALTPMDKEFYENVEDPQPLLDKMAGPAPLPFPIHHEPMRASGKAASLRLEPPRQTRQNPMAHKQRHLVEPDLETLKHGHLHEGTTDTDRPRHIHVIDSGPDAVDSVYGVALIAAVGCALTMAIAGLAFGWYTVSSNAKAAADVDYPAYGVTGPNYDSGDRKLAHSAHMYHYQHQKQQIIAMERNGLEQRNNSISDPESEEDNEEGDYTVYECPGFATTGEMEVKNPLFNDTPATPGKCEVVKQQPKN